VCSITEEYSTGPDFTPTPPKATLAHQENLANSNSFILTHTHMKRSKYKVHSYLFPLLTGKGEQQQ
jgi:hypothetical protein